MGKKTQAMRVLDGKKVVYEVYSYPETERDAVKIAEIIGASPREVYKTLVIVRSSGKPMLCMIPADKHINLKKLAKEVREKKVKMAKHGQAEALTGMKVGGISALSLLNQGFDMYIDRSSELLQKIFVSAGTRGIQIRLSVQDIKTVTGAKLVEIID